MGLDASKGTLLIHDPSAFRTVEHLFGSVRGNSSPLGPQGMAVVAPDRAPFLDSFLTRSDMDVTTASQRHQKALMTNGPAAARRIEPLFLGYEGRLSNAREMIFLVAERFGIDVAEQAASRWSEQRPDEPKVIEAAADLVLTHGPGRAVAACALAMLDAAVSGLHLVGRKRPLTSITWARVDSAVSAPLILWGPARLEQGLSCSASSSSARSL